MDISDKNNPVEVLKRCVASSRETHVLITITGLTGDWQHIKPGQVIRYSGRESVAVIGDQVLQDNLHQIIQNQLQSGHSAPHHFELQDGKELDLFIEILPPEISIVLMGHQYDVYPLSRLIKEIGWRLAIVAEPQKINSHIVAIADEVVAPGDFSSLFTDRYTAIILMAHDYKTDKRNLPKAIATSAAYIGMLGPRIRSEKIWGELENEGKAISPEDMDRIHAPVGLDIGAVTPEEIALSLIAEVKAALSGRDGSYLRLRQNTIHQRG